MQVTVGWQLNWLFQMKQTELRSVWNCEIGCNLRNRQWSRIWKWACLAASVPLIKVKPNGSQKDSLGLLQFVVVPHRFFSCLNADKESKNSRSPIAYQKQTDKRTSSEMWKHRATRSLLRLTTNQVYLLSTLWWALRILPTDNIAVKSFQSTSKEML